VDDKSKAPWPGKVYEVSLRWTAGALEQRQC
jgi:hypothetical protein